MAIDRTAGLDPVLFTAHLSEWLDVPVGTLRYWRHANIGPRSFRIGRRIAYRRADVEAWLQAQQSKEATPA